MSLSLSISHRLDYKSKIETGNKALESLQKNAEESECWAVALENIENKCKVRSETPRLLTAIAFVQCTQYGNPCVDIFPLNYWYVNNNLKKSVTKQN